MTDQPHVETTPETSPEQQADLDQLDSLAADLVGPEIPGTDPEPGPEENKKPKIPTDKMLEPVVSMMCRVVVPAWNISPEEQHELCRAYAEVIDKYLPDDFDLGPEFGAVFLTAAIVVPRLDMPMRDEPGAGNEADD